MSGQESPNLAARLSQVSDRVKGILIVLVAVDHNDWFRQLAPRMFDPLTFHVLGFFLLAFSFGTKPWCGRFVADRLVRYLVPFWWALAAASLAFGLFFRGGSSLVDGVIHFLLAALIGGADLVKASSGLLMLWFLPCLFGLTCLLAFYDSLVTRRARQVGLGLALGAHVLLPVLVQPWMQWLPFGLAVAADVFVLGLIWRQLLQRRLPGYVGPLALIVCIACYGTLVLAKTHIEIGTLEIRAMTNPLILLLHDVTAISAMVTMIWVAENVAVTRWLDGIGKHSLLVYLMHPIFYVMLSMLWVSPAQADGSKLMLGLHACVTTAIAVSLAYGIARLVSGSPTLSTWIAPRSWRQWPIVIYMSGGSRAQLS
jgi:hypothetical protein